MIEKRGENSYNVQRSNGAIVPVNVKDLKPAPPSIQQQPQQPNQLKAEDLIGKRVKVYWPQYKKNFAGTVVRVNQAKNHYRNKGSHVIRYDDDGKEYYEWLTGSPPPGLSLEKS